MYFDGLRVCEVFEAESTKIHYTYGDNYTANTATKCIHCLKNAGGMLMVVLVKVCERF